MLSTNKPMEPQGEEKDSVEGLKNQIRARIVELQALADGAMEDMLHDIVTDPEERDVYQGRKSVLGCIERFYGLQKLNDPLQLGAILNALNEYRVTARNEQANLLSIELPRKLPSVVCSSALYPPAHSQQPPTAPSVLQPGITPRAPGKR